MLNCSNSSEFADDLTRGCVATCPLGFYRDSSTFKCVLNCPEVPTRSFASDTTFNCMSRCPSTYFADKSTGKCVRNCSSQYPITYAETNSSTCVDMCPLALNLFANPVTLVCGTSCNGGYYADSRNRMCVQSCGNHMYGDNAIVPPSCVSRCSSTTYADPLTFKC